MSEDLYPLLSGAIAMGFFVGGLFFLRFWSRTRDQLFLAFAFAFWLMTANQALASLFGHNREDRSWFYLLRLAAFLLIIVAVLRKNLGGAKKD